jgi:hypothetical protein
VEVKTPHEGLDHATHMIGWNQIIQCHRKQCLLIPRFTLDITDTCILPCSYSPLPSFVTDCKARG